MPPHSASSSDIEVLVSPSIFTTWLHVLVSRGFGLASSRWVASRTSTQIKAETASSAHHRTVRLELPGSERTGIQ
ncbi:unnamed protein product [Urochloa humidicola]